MILAPNNLFLDYIRDVLPELGVERVKQTTFASLTAELLGKKIKLINEGKKLTDFLDGHLSLEEEEMLRRVSSYRGSMAFKELIDTYVDQVEETYPPTEDFTLAGEVLVSAEKIEQLIREETRHLPLFKRAEEVSKALKNHLKMRKKEILKRTKEAFNSKIDHLRFDQEPSEERRRMILHLMEKRDETIAEIEKEARTAVKRYMKWFPSSDLLVLYREFIATADHPEEIASLLREVVLAHLDRKRIEREDVAGLLYLRHRLMGFDADLEINSIVVDEAQDFSTFEFYMLKTIYKTEKLTLLGDLSQGIHVHRGIENWQEMMAEVFGDRAQFMTLERSYRTTVEIMNLANAVIGTLNDEGLVPAKPVIRHGDKPLVEAYAKKTALYHKLAERILDLDATYASVAVLVKNEAEAKKVKRQLDKRMDADLAILTGEMDHYGAGVTIVPVHLAKGLEFDAVIIAVVEAAYAGTTVETKLLYVAMTRALHHLSILHMEGLLPLLEHIDDETVERTA